MFARVTPYKMKPGTRDAAIARLESMRTTILGMPGMQQFINVMNEDGNGNVVAMVDGKASSDATPGP